MSLRDDAADLLQWAAYRLDPLLGRRDYVALCRRLHEDVHRDPAGLPDWRGPHAKALREKAKRLKLPMVSARSRSSSALMCEHANEMPRGPCPCPADGYGKDNSCRNERRAAAPPLIRDTNWLMKTAQAAYPCPVGCKAEDEIEGWQTYSYWPNESGRPQVLRLDLGGFFKPTASAFRVVGLTVLPNRAVLQLEQGTWKVALVFYLTPLPPEEKGDFWAKLTGEDSL